MSHVTTPAGLRLEVLTMGPADGYPLVYHGGSPSAAVEYPPWLPMLATAGMRLVTYSRPGYGTSIPRPARPAPWPIADDVPDTVAVLDGLGIGEFVTLGWSGGGPRALACAALLPARCRAAVSLAGVAPYDAPGLDWFSGMGPENVRDFRAASRGRAAMEPLVVEQALDLAGVTAAGIAESLGGLVDEVDIAALDAPLAEFLAASMRRAVLHGPTGLLEDSLSVVAPWGFDVSGITVPTSIWQGSHDLMVPFGHGRWLAEQIPEVRAHLLDDEGHLSLVHRVDEVLTELRDLAGL